MRSRMPAILELTGHVTADWRTLEWLTVATWGSSWRS